MALRGTDFVTSDDDDPMDYPATMQNEDIIEPGDNRTGVEIGCLMVVVEGNQLQQD